MTYAREAAFYASGPFIFDVVEGVRLTITTATAKAEIINRLRIESVTAVLADAHRVRHDDLINAIRDARAYVMRGAPTAETAA